MSSYTIASLPRISAEELHAMLSSSSPPSPTASSSTADAMTTRDVAAAAIADTVSPSKRPKSVAVIDVRDSDYIGGHILGGQNIPSSTMDAKAPELVRTLADKDVVVFHCMLSQQRGPGAALKYLREKERMGVKGNQKVVVLDGGFSAWQADYGLDKKVTEGYRKELWD